MQVKRLETQFKQRLTRGRNNFLRQMIPKINNPNEKEVTTLFMFSIK